MPSRIPSLIDSPSMLSSSRFVIYNDVGRSRGGMASFEIQDIAAILDGKRPAWASDPSVPGHLSPRNNAVMELADSRLFSPRHNSVVVYQGYRSGTLRHVSARRPQHGHSSEGSWNTPGPSACLECSNQSRIKSARDSEGGRVVVYNIDVTCVNQGGAHAAALTTINRHRIASFVALVAHNHF